jgi:hypothetical protein
MAQPPLLPRESGTGGVPVSRAAPGR